MTTLQSQEKHWCVKVRDDSAEVSWKQEVKGATRLSARNIFRSP